jgi:acyl-CoA reductase-like NAD-dependent aldehyde dehydrogenase
MRVVVQERSNFLLKWHRQIMDNQEELAKIMTLEMVARIHVLKLSYNLFSANAMHCDVWFKYCVV